MQGSGYAFDMSTESQNSSRSEGGDPVDFGFREVPRDAKPGLVRDLFSGVANRYDLMNDAMSVGVHRIWKNAMVDWLAPRPGSRILDLAGGTGDIAFRVLERTRGAAEVTVCDLAEAMIRKGRERKAAGQFDSSLGWVCGDGARLPFADRSFDACTVAFGLRNVADLPLVLSEVYRTLRPGGRFLSLEFSRVHPPVISDAYDAWSFRVIPLLGARVARDRAAYRYLVESIRRFPNQKRFANLICEAGFTRVNWRNLSFGIVALHSGWRT